MSPMEYLINAGFVLMVVKQARERRLDRRALVIPLVLVFSVAQQYLHTIPVSGNDLVLIGLLASAGVGLGLLRRSNRPSGHSPRGAHTLTQRSNSGSWPPSSTSSRAGPPRRNRFPTI